jgi:hypothetical protein
MVYASGSKNRRAFHYISDTGLFCFNEEHYPNFRVPISLLEYKTKQVLMAVI